MVVIVNKNYRYYKEGIICGNSLGNFARLMDKTEILDKSRMRVVSPDGDVLVSTVDLTSNHHVLFNEGDKVFVKCKENDNGIFEIVKPITLILNN